MKKIFLFLCLVFLLSCQTGSYTKENLMNDYGETYPIISTIIHTLDLDEREVHLLESTDRLGFSLNFSASEPVLKKLSEDILDEWETYILISINDSELILESDLNILQISYLDEKILVRINPVSEDEKTQLLTAKEEETLNLS